jgi:integrase
MKKARLTEEQIIGLMQEHEAGAKCADLCRKHGMSEGTFYAWKAKYSGMTVSEAILICLSEGMTKTGVPWEAAVPPRVEPLLRRYITEVRPSLMARGKRRHDRLWVCKKGEKFEENYLGQRIGGLTLALTGKRIPPHFFRDSAATTLARISPEAARLIRPVLAHSGFKTAERHYIHAQTIEAGRDYAEVVKKLKG